MEWNHKFSVGIEEIDRQHKILLTHFKNVEQTLNDESRWYEVHYELLKLSEYAAYHFHFEESLMRLFGYEDVDSHSKQHQHYVNELNKKISRVLNSEVSRDILVLLKDWIVKHIQGADIDYATHIRNGANVVFSDRGA